MRITRRHLLALGALAAAGAAAGTATVAVRWWDQSPADGFEILSPDEAAFLVALAEVAWPATTELPSHGGELALDRFVDGVLASMPDTSEHLVRVLMHALDAAPLPVAASSFVDLDPAARQSVFMGWFDHPLLEVRSALLSLVIILGMGWSSHPDNAGHFAAMSGCGYGR